MDKYVAKPYSLHDLEQALETINEIDEDSSSMRGSGQSVKPSDAEASDSIIEQINYAAVKNILDVEKQTGKKIVPQIFQGYQEQMQIKLDELESLLSHSKPDMVRKTAHAIKSMSANIGANKVKLLSSEIESQAANDQLVDLDCSFKNLGLAYEDFVKIFTAEFLS